MKLTLKDKEFIERLQELIEEEHLWIERSRRPPGYFILRGTYGSHAETKFHRSRQGVRWRFWRLFNEIYVSAYLTILYIEKAFGTRLREEAMEIARARYLERQEALNNVSFQEANTYRNKN